MTLVSGKKIKDPVIHLKSSYISNINGIFSSINHLKSNYVRSLRSQAPHFPQ